jgi:hypothetical protein
MTDIKNAEQTSKFVCELCKFKTSKNSNYISHLMTPKHKNNDAILTNTDEKNANNEYKFLCKCNKKYKHRQSLFLHKKKCNFIENNIQNANDKVDLISYLMKENSDFKELLLEQNKIMMKIASKNDKQ